MKGEGPCRPATWLLICRRLSNVSKWDFVSAHEGRCVVSGQLDTTSLLLSQSIRKTVGGNWAKLHTRMTTLEPRWSSLDESAPATEADPTIIPALSSATSRRLILRPPFLIRP